MTPNQVAKVNEGDAHARAEFNTAMSDLDAIPTDSTNSPSQPDIG